MRRFAWPISKELRKAIEQVNEANKAAKVESRKPMRVQRLEARAVVRELKHNATMTKAQRSRAEQLRQANLAAKRELFRRSERVGAILAGLPVKEKKTDLGIILPSGADIGSVLTRVRE